MTKKKLFISYSHEDTNKVKKFALLLSLHGFDLWMDEKKVWEKRFDEYYICFKYVPGYAAREGRITEFGSTENKRTCKTVWKKY